jgi:translation initiation factor 2-alpha kinase 4
MLSSLFNQEVRQSRSFLYDAYSESAEFASLTGVVLERLTTIFRLHGAVDMEPPLLMPIFHADDQKNRATFVDRHGDLVTLPNNIWTPFARLAARAEHSRIKRYHIRDSYDPKYVDLVSTGLVTF